MFYKLKQTIRKPTVHLLFASLVVFGILLFDTKAHGEEAYLASNGEITRTEPIISEVLSSKMLEEPTNLEDNPVSTDLSPSNNMDLNLLLAALQVVSMGFLAWKEVKISRVDDLKSENTELKAKNKELEREIDNHTSKKIKELEGEVNRLKSNK